MFDHAKIEVFVGHHCGVVQYAVNIETRSWGEIGQTHSEKAVRVDGIAKREPIETRRGC